MYILIESNFDSFLLYYGYCNIMKAILINYYNIIGIVSI